MNLLKSFLIRLFVVIVPLLGLYYYSEIAFEANRNREHPTDVGLGMAVFLFFILLFLFVGFTIDIIIRFVKKEYKIVMIDTIFLLPFVFLLLYIATLFSGGPLYKIVKNLHNQEFIYIVIIYLFLISLGFWLVFKRSLKIIIGYVTIILIICGGYFYNKYSIEKYYGDNKDIFFEGGVGDNIVAYGTGNDKISVLEQERIERKTFNRIYIKTDSLTIELNEWIKLIEKKYSEKVKCHINKY